MRQGFLIVLFQAYATLFAVLQWQIGVRTDEAKYLLNIAYPHPPLVRALFGFTKSLIFQEFLWRLVLATLCVQSVWLVRRLLRDVPRKKRIIACAVYLFSGALVLQAGTIMMAPLTALEGLVLLLIAHEWETARPEMEYVLLGLYWLACLFTAYQAVLFLPLVIGILWRSRMAKWRQAIIVLGPLFLLALYSLTNPLALASMLNLAAADAGLDLYDHIAEFLRTFLTAGTGIFSLVGLLGLFAFKRLDVLLTLFCIALYVLLSPQDYYAILFLPFLILGFGSFLRATPFPAGPGVLAAVIAGLLWLPFPPRFNLARSMAESVPFAAQDDIMIVGSFGHEWQYYFPRVLRYTETYAGRRPDAVICLSDCPKHAIENFKRIQGTAVPAYHNL